MCVVCEVSINRVLSKNNNMLVPYYLILSYIYYEQDDSIVSDSFYDETCAALRLHWHSVEHRHKHLIDKASLKTGSGYYLHRKFPGIVKGAGNALIVVCKQNQRRKFTR